MGNGSGHTICIPCTVMSWLWWSDTAIQCADPAGTGGDTIGHVSRDGNGESIASSCIGPCINGGVLLPLLLLPRQR